MPKHIRFNPQSGPAREARVFGVDLRFAGGGSATIIADTGALQPEQRSVPLEQFTAALKKAHGDAQAAAEALMSDELKGELRDDPEPDQ